MTDQKNVIKEESSGNERDDTRDLSFLEYLASAEALIDKCPMKTPGNIGERMIHMTSGTVLFALVLAETSDSFIVSYPTVLTNNNGKVEGRLMMETHQSRLFKSCIVTISKPSDLHKYYYLRFLIEDLVEIPSVLTGKRLEHAYEFISSYKDKTLKTSENSVSKEDLETEEDKDFDDVPSRMFAPYRKKTRH